MISCRFRNLYRNINLWEARAAIFFKPVFSNFLKLCNSQFHTNHLIESDEFQVEKTLFLNITLQLWVPLYNVGLIKTSTVYFIWGHKTLRLLPKVCCDTFLGLRFLSDHSSHSFYLSLFPFRTKPRCLRRLLDELCLILAVEW